MDDIIFKSILDEIVKPIKNMNKFKMEGVIRKMKKGSMADRMAAASLQRLDNYINLSLEISKEQEEKLHLFIQDPGIAYE